MCTYPVRVTTSLKQTFTMMGAGWEGSRANAGLYELAAADIFQVR